MNSESNHKPTKAYIGLTWTCLGSGVLGFLIGLYNANLQFNEKGFFFTVLVLGLFSAIALQKTIRDKSEGISTTPIFIGACWGTFGTAVLLLCIGLFNADLLLSEKGFYSIAFLMSLFSIITAQKNIRDAAWSKDESYDDEDFQKGEKAKDSFPKNVVSNSEFEK
jgi:uncharacterized membrane protein YiaA